MLYKRHHILRFWSLLMLIIFTISITPKNYLHDLFANHTHVFVIKKDHSSKASIVKEIASCDFYTHSSIMPLALSTDAIGTDLFLKFYSFDTSLPSPLPKAIISTNALRGPPSMI